MQNQLLFPISQCSNKLLLRKNKEVVERNQSEGGHQRKGFKSMVYVNQKQLIEKKPEKGDSG